MTDLEKCANAVWKVIKKTETGVGISYGEIYQEIKKYFPPDADQLE